MYLAAILLCAGAIFLACAFISAMNL
jgi:hypothetical protein